MTVPCTDAAASDLDKVRADIASIEKVKLAGILTHHVVSGIVMATAVVRLTSASNGVIHVIDAVLVRK